VHRTSFILITFLAVAAFGTATSRIAFAQGDDDLLQGLGEDTEKKPAGEGKDEGKKEGTGEGDKAPTKPVKKPPEPAAGEKPKTEKPAEKPAETPAAKPTEKAADKPAEKPADKPVDEIKAAAADASAAASDDKKKEEEIRKALQVNPAKLDRIKAVQHKPVLKQYRFEVTPLVGLSLNDAFYTHLAVGAGAAFFVHDNFGIGANGTFFLAHPRTDNHKVVRIGQKGVAAVFDLADVLTTLDLHWVPIYGKVSLFNQIILPFDFYLIAGGGLAVAGANIRPALSGALGQRFMINDWLAVRLEIRDTFYNDTQEVEGQPRSDIQNYILFTAGVSFFIPPYFEYSGL
jgi:outer membrane beta-barrel protein